MAGPNEEYYNETQCRIVREIVHMMAEFDISFIDIHEGQHNFYYETTDGRKVMADKRKESPF